MRRPILCLLLSALCAGISFILRPPDPSHRLAYEARHLQAALDQAAAELQAFATAHANELSALGPHGWMMTHVDELEAERMRTGTVLLGLEGDSLVCWSGQPPLRPGRLVGDTGAHLKLGSGIFLHARAMTSVGELHALRPVWSVPPIENRALRRAFHASWGLPATLSVPEDGSGPVVHDRTGAPLLALAWKDAGPPNTWTDVSKLSLLALSAVLFVMALWMIARRVVRTGRPWTGIVLFIGSAMLWRWASLYWHVLKSFGHLPLFDPAVYAASFAFPSLGDLVINALLLVAAATFVHRVLRQFPPTRISFHATFLSWCTVLLFAAWTTWTFIGLVLDSSVDLDLRRVPMLGLESWVAILGIALLLGAWLLLAIALMRTFVLPLSATPKWAAAALAVALSITLHHLYGVVDTILFLWPLPVLVLLATRRDPRPGFVSVLFCIAVLSAFSAHVLSRSTREREQRERAVLAERLVSREDPVVESLFHEVAPAIRRDVATYDLITGRTPCDATELDRVIRQRFFGGYWERYDVRLFGFATEGGPMCASDTDPPRSVDNDDNPFTPLLAAADMPDLFMEERPGSPTFYYSRIAVMPHDSLPPALLVLELHPRPWGQSFGFPDLLLSGEDPLARRAGRYVQARYQQGLLVEASPGLDLPLHWEHPLDTEGSVRFQHQGYELLGTGDPDGALLVLGLPRPGPVALATTFSYLFALYSVLAALVFLAIAFGRPLRPAAPGIATKVRIALAVLVLSGLALFGMGTRYLVARQYERHVEAGLLQKARSVHAELQQRLHGEPVLGPAHAAYLEHLLGRLSNVFFTDISVYSVEGRILASSRPQIFAAGLMGRRMDPVAFERMVLRGASSLVHYEAIGSAGFHTAYLPLRDRHGQVLAYIALPAFADLAQQEAERTDVWVAVINLFVVLFALSALAAVIISNWTTLPLDLLKQALSRVVLQGTNRPLPYQGNDEVGQLVEVYNRKVEELRESAEKLARSERESAWKEMARQVAHEIKNPLTPMKLSIQHFQRSWDPTAPDARERLDRFSNNLVEQIDVLSRIAGEFSHFAQMPPAHPAPLDLVEVVDASVHLFASTPDCTVRMSHEGPLPVLADREHLLRTFNNLIKNAIQSIPDGVDGRVEVLLRRDGNEAITEVRDNGTGIPADVRDQVFVPKFSTKSSGMGLGLPMVKRMVESAGGRVWFDTEEGRGTSFFVALPLRG